MLFKGRHIDHLVYCVKDLEKAISFIEMKTGFKASIGGKHRGKGTKNALINLGEKCYLEILAIDGLNSEVSPPRWMGIDFIKEPKITRICLKSKNLRKDQHIIKQYNANLGEIDQGSRATVNGEILHWKMILPLAKPEVDPIPFMVDWSESEMHPTENLPKQCKLIDLEFHGNQPNLHDCMNALFDEIEIIESCESKIIATIDGPKGIFKI